MPHVFLWGIGVKDGERLESFIGKIVWQKCVSPDFAGLTHLLFQEERMVFHEQKA